MDKVNRNRVQEFTDLERNNEQFGQQINIAFRELTGQLKSINACAWPLAGLGLACSILMMMNYVDEYKLPLNPLSSGIISAFPALIVYSALVVMAVAILLLMPTFILFASPDEKKVPLIGRFQYLRSNGGKGQRQRLLLMLIWVANGLLNALVLWGGVTWAVNSQLQSPWLAGVPILIQITITAFMLIKICRCVGISIRNMTHNFYFQALAVGVAHASLMLVLYALAISRAESFGAGQWGSLVVLAIVVTIALFVQLILVMFFYDTRLYRQPFPSFVVVAFIITALSTAISPVSAQLARSAFQVRGPSGGACMVLGMTSDSKSLLPSALQGNAAGRSVPLRIYIEANGKYYARPYNVGAIPVDNERDVHLIPVASISKISDCPDESTSAKGSA
ncbi:hypothetical protein W822_00025 [Advenella kashmirensis W13003]|uniref:Uncharacterized protein n=1 Tax=Advenella kashmirensis W13003 TaxID=1424334 RepID=V8QYB1_9BURK|nr:hypothetical protein [Advenella kashmirensis]ETF04612.1 hypothetical protein W822_00025 [Advenella kashmirensis W13003]